MIGRARAFDGAVLFLPKLLDPNEKVCVYGNVSGFMAFVCIT